MKSGALQEEPPAAANGTTGFSADLSAWMDGELPPARAQLVYRGIGVDASRREQWSRYHLIGDALRGSLPEQGLKDISAAVMACLDDSPAQPATAFRIIRAPHLWGLAASLMLAAVIIANPWSTQDPQRDAVQVAQAETAASDNPVPTSAEEGDADEQDDAVAQALLESYLRNHSQALVDAGEGARMLPYLSMAEYAIDPVTAANK